MPDGAPSGRARSIATAASAFEQNHFSPRRRKRAPSGVATVVSRPTSEPPSFSVMNWAPCVSRVHVRLREPVEICGLERGVPEARQEHGRAVRHVDRAAEAEFRLVEEVRERVLGDGGVGRGPAQDARAVGHGVDAELAVGDALELSIRGVVLDPLLVAPEAVAGVQNGHVPVGEARAAIQLVAREGAQAVEMGLDVTPERRGQIDSSRSESERSARKKLRPVVSGATRLDGASLIGCSRRGALRTRKREPAAQTACSWSRVYRGSGVRPCARARPVRAASAASALHCPGHGGRAHGRRRGRDRGRGHRGRVGGLSPRRCTAAASRSSSGARSPPARPASTRG